MYKIYLFGFLLPLEDLIPTGHLLYQPHIARLRRAVHQGFVDGMSFKGTYII